MNGELSSDIYLYRDGPKGSWSHGRRGPTVCSDTLISYLSQCHWGEHGGYERAMPKKWTSLLFVLWLLVIAICAERVVHWDGVSEDAHIEWYGDSSDPKDWDGEELFDNRDADSKTAMWLTAGVVWVFGGSISPIWVRKLNASDIVSG
jgi:hypothetical protein